MPHPQREPLHGRRVLVVEDDHFLAMDLSHELEEQGAEVLGPAPSVREALDLLAREALPDIAILDVKLRDELVFPVAEALKSRGLPFLFVTGHSHGVVPADYAEVPCCSKPISSRELVRLLTSGSS